MDFRTLMRMLQEAETGPKGRKTSWRWDRGRRVALPAAIPATTAELLRRGVERVEEIKPAPLPVKELWVCPFCRSKRVALYHMTNGTVACRKCARLAYESEQELRYLNSPERIEQVRGKAVKATPHMSKKLQAKAAAAEEELHAREEARRLRRELSQRTTLMRAVARLNGEAYNEEEDDLAPLRTLTQEAEARVAEIVAKQRAKAWKAYERRHTT